MNRLLTADKATLGTIRIERSLADAVLHRWDDTTLELLFASFTHSDHSEGVMTFSRISCRMGTIDDQTVVLANRPQLLRDLEAEYEKLGPLP